VIKGIALIVLLAILIFILWCFIMGKCKGHAFGMIPPRPQTVGRRKSDKDLDVSGSGSAGIGASGSGSGSLLGNLTSRFQGKTTVSSGQKKQQQQQSKPCSGLDPLSWFGCHVGNGWNMLVGKISDATPIPYSPITGQPILVAP
jgi:hypothetical protein